MRSHARALLLAIRAPGRYITRRLPVWALLAFALSNASAADTLIEVDTGRTTGLFSRSPAVLRAILSTPEQPTKTALLFFRGWPGIGWIESAGDKARNLLPFMRATEPMLHEAGIALVVVDCPTDQWGAGRKGPAPISCDDGFRSSPDHAEDVRRLIRKLAADHGLTEPYLLGHSYGTVSSKWLAVALGTEIKGSIHSAAMTVQAGGSFARYGFSAGRVPLQEIRAPVLHIHHREDACRTTPYATVQAYAGENLVTVLGGTPAGDPCGGGHHHSYLGVERAVGAAIVRWIATGQVTSVAGD